MSTLFVVNATNSLKSPAVSSDSESKLEPFITQTKAALVAVLPFELSENNFESSFAGAETEQAVYNFNFCTEDVSTDLHVYG